LFLTRARAIPAFGERARFVQLYSNIEPIRQRPMLVACSSRDALTDALTQAASEQ